MIPTEGIESKMLLALEMASVELGVPGFWLEHCPLCIGHRRPGEIVGFAIYVPLKGHCVILHLGCARHMQKNLARPGQLERAIKKACKTLGAAHVYGAPCTCGCMKGFTEPVRH